METIKTERYAACFELFLRLGGTNLLRIEREMRALGYADFNRRILYGRKENGIYKPGWIERYGWRSHLMQNAKCRMQNEHLVQNAECRTQNEHLVQNAKCRMQNEGESARIRQTAGNPHSAIRIPQSKVPQSKVPQSFKDWLKSVSPEMTWNWRYQKYIYKYLQKVTDGTCKRLMIFLPPRHGKSELVTVRYAGWRLWNDPKIRVIVSSYNQKLADKFSRSIRRLLSTEEEKLNPADSFSTAETQRRGGTSDISSRRLGVSAVDPQPVRAGGPETPGRMFPKTRTINTVSQWETALGGGVKAVGVGAGVTGFGAQLVVIDDPVKSRADAESETLARRFGTGTTTTSTRASNQTPPSSSSKPAGTRTTSPEDCSTK